MQVVEAVSDTQHDTLDSAGQAIQRQELHALLAQAAVGLSGVDDVIAETGTLVVSARPGQMRRVSLLPPVHIAVAYTEQIVATIAEPAAGCGGRITTALNELRLLYHCSEPHGRHRADVDSRGPWPR